MTKHANYSEFIERFLDCPYCGKLISDYENLDKEEISAGEKIKCPECGKMIIIDGEN